MDVLISDVRDAIGVTSTTDLLDTVITHHLDSALEEVERITNTRYYPPLDNGTATATFAAGTLVDSTKTWSTNKYANYIVYIYEGTGAGQLRTIASNNGTTLTLSSNWTTTPDATSKYFISYDNKETDVVDGNNKDYIFTKKLPLIQVDSLTVSSTSVTPSYLTTYNSGKIKLTTNAEVGSFNCATDKNITIVYHYGVLPTNRRGKLQLPINIMRLWVIIAGIRCLVNLTGGTYNNISSFSVPNLTGNTPPNYLVHKQTMDALKDELKLYKDEYVSKWAYFG